MAFTLGDRGSHVSITLAESQIGPQFSQDKIKGRSYRLRYCVIRKVLWIYRGFRTASTLWMLIEKPLRRDQGRPSPKQPWRNPSPLPSPFPFLPSPTFSPFPYSSFTSPPCPSFPSFLPLEVGILNPAIKGAWGALQALPAGSGAEPQPQSNLVHFCFKIWNLVAAFSMIFLRINLPNFVQCKQYQGKSEPRRTTRYFVQIYKSKIFQFSLLWI